MHSKSEENYLKAIYALTEQDEQGASTTAVAKKLDTKASSVTDMVKKLADKSLVNYKKYQGVTLTEEGRRIAVNIIRKHRLWEVFLVNHLNFRWDEVHEIAEQLEHIRSSELTDRLDHFLDHPRFDPHGDPIPDADGNIISHQETFALSELTADEQGIIVGVDDSSSAFLQYLENQNLILGKRITVVQVFEYDQSMSILVEAEAKTISHQVSKNLFVKKTKA